MNKTNICIRGFAERAWENYYNNLGDHYVHEVRFGVVPSIPEGYNQNIKPTDMDLVFSTLVQHIDNDNFENFQKVASGKCLYKCIRTFRENSKYYDDTDFYLPGGDYQTWTYRLRLEALFLEKPEEFKQLLNRLIEKNNPQLFEAFFKSLKDSFLNQESFFTWDTEKDVSLLKDKILLLKEHLKTLNNPEKNEKISNLIVDLESKIDSFKPVDSDSVEQKQLRCLLFRCELFTMARREDKVLEKDKPYLRLICNICSVIFTAGIANLINFMFTGKFSFFAEKPLEAGMKDLQKDIMPTHNI